MKQFLQILVLILSISQIFTVIPYSYESGGSDWTGTCSEGKMQSPVDIIDVKNTCDNSMVLEMNFIGPLQDAKMYYNGYNVVGIIVNDGTDMLGNGSTSTTNEISDLFATDVEGNLFGYSAVSITAHAPAEHTIEGEEYAAEVQIIYKIKNQFKVGNYKDYAIVSFIFEINDEETPNTFFANFSIGSADSGTGSTFNLETALKDAVDLKGEYFTYQGSQTYPGCDENVNWYIYKEIMKITTSQHSSLESLFARSDEFSNFKGNNRKIQDIEDRDIKRGNVECQEQFIYFFSFFILYVFINYFIFKLL